MFLTDYEQRVDGSWIPQDPWPRELVHHEDLELFFGRPFDGWTGFEVCYVCRTCMNKGAMISPAGDDPEQLAFLAASFLAALPCAGTSAGATARSAQPPRP